jgi:hypothetical protein
MRGVSHLMLKFFLNIVTSNMSKNLVLVALTKRLEYQLEFYVIPTRQQLRRSPKDKSSGKT